MWVKIIQHHFYEIQIIMGATFLSIAWIFVRPKTPDSSFKLREADLEKLRRAGNFAVPQEVFDLGNARLKRSEPLALPGIRLDVSAHELLGVPNRATPEQIQKAYRDLMKRYHPDIIGRPGSREWNDAQKIAEAINRAKEELLKKRA